MAVIELEERTSSSSGVMLVQVASVSSLVATGGDMPQADALVRSDADLVAAMLAATRPVADDRFVG